MKPLKVVKHGTPVFIYNTGGKVGRCFAQGRFYEQPLLEHIYRMKPKGTALDIGANVGNHTLWLAAVCKLAVHSFEPLLVQNLYANIALNKLGHRVRVHPLALGEQDGTLYHTGKGRLSPEPEHTGGTDIASGQESGQAAVTQHRLDDLGIKGPRISLVKIDVEDMEPQVLRGGLATLRRHRPVVFAEARDQSAHERIADVLRPLGYTMTLRLSGKRAATPMEQWECS